MSGLKKVFAFVLPGVISIGLLAFLYRDVRISTLTDEFGKANLSWVVAYIVLSMIEPLVRGLRWSFLMSLKSKRIAVKGLYIAKAGNNLLPLRMGDAIRAQYLRDRANVPYSRAIASFFAESVLDLVLLGMILLTFALFVASSKGYLLAAILIVGLPVVLLAGWKVSGSLRGKMCNSGLITALGSIRDHLGSIVRIRAKTAVILYSLLLWTLTLAACYCGLRMFLPSVTLLGVVAAIVFVYFSILVPSAPGFIGTYHAAMAGSLLVMGYDLASYPAVPIAVHLLQFVPQTVIGLLLGMGYLFSNNWREALGTMNRSRKRLFGRKVVS